MRVGQWTKLTLSGLGLALLSARATEVGPKTTPACLPAIFPQV